jgi:hypothetical protein
VKRVAGMSAARRSRSVAAGVLLIVLGVWGGLAHFVGPYFHYAYTPDTAWHVTMARVWLEIVPAAATVAGGALVLVSTGRLRAASGAILAMLAGGWFVVGRAVSEIWPDLGTAGVPAGTSPTRMATEELGLFTGLGVVILVCATLVLGRALTTVTLAETGQEADEEAEEEEPDEEAGTMTGRVLAKDFGPPRAVSVGPGTRYSGGGQSAGSLFSRQDRRSAGSGSSNQQPAASPARDAD